MRHLLPRARQTILRSRNLELPLSRLGRVNGGVKHGGCQQIDQRLGRDRAGESAREHVAKRREGGSPDEERSCRRDEERVKKSDSDTNRYVQQYSTRMFLRQGQSPYDEEDQWRGRTSCPRAPALMKINMSL